MNPEITNFLRAILTGDMTLKSIREKAFDLIESSLTSIPKTIAISKGEARAIIPVATLDEICRLAREGKKIAAIKLLRDSTSPAWGLKDSKDFVDAL